VGGVSGGKPGGAGMAGGGRGAGGYGAISGKSMKKGVKLNGGVCRKRKFFWQNKRNDPFIRNAENRNFRVTAARNKNKAP